jgi:hypothetical protein
MDRAGTSARFNRGKQKLGPISKQGDRYLVVGTHAALRRAKQSPQNYPWLVQLSARQPLPVLHLDVALRRHPPPIGLYAKQHRYTFLYRGKSAELRNSHVALLTTARCSMERKLP